MYVKAKINSVPCDSTSNKATSNNQATVQNKKLNLNLTSEPQSQYYAKAE